MYYSQNIDMQVLKCKVVKLKSLLKVRKFKKV